MSHADEHERYEILNGATDEPAVDYTWASHGEAYEFLMKSNHPEDYNIRAVVVEREVVRREDHPKDGPS